MDLKTKALSEGVPIIKDGTLEHLKGLIIKNSYRNILELGTAVGYSAIEMARVDPLIHIDTIERDKERYEEALRNIADEHLQDQIDVYLEDIRELKLWHDYDLIFIDAAKAHYKEYLEMTIDHLVPYGTIVFDNIAFHGFVKDNSLTHNRHTLAMVKKMQAFLDYVQDDKRFDIMLNEDIGDGILEVRRKKS